MKNKIMVLGFVMMSCIISGDFGGYSIFEYNNNAFEMKRVYLQYTDDLSEDLFLNIRYDIDREGKLNTYLKNAYVDWNIEKIGKLSLGLIGTNSYGIQESTWGYRFVEKSLLDKSGFTNTADLGIGFSKKLDVANIHLNIQLLNGEGFKLGDSDKTLSTYIRLVYGEKKLNKNDGFNIGGIYTSNSNTDNRLFGLFGGYAKEHIRMGAEYNIHTSNELKIKLTSLYADFRLSEKTNIFFRSDMSSGEDILNSENESYLFGCALKLTKGLYVSPHVVISDSVNGEDYKLSFMFKY